MSASIDFAELFKRLPGAFMVIDRDHRLVAASDNYLAVTGRDRGVIGRGVFDVYPENDERTQKLRDSFERAFSGEESVLAVLPFAVERGETRFWSATHVPLRDGTGAITHVLQHTQDVTSLVDATQSTDGLASDVVRRAVRVEALSDALRAEGDFLKSMFRATPGFMAVLGGPNFVFELANEAYLQLVGRSDIIGKPIREALPDLDGQGFFEMLEDAYRTGEPFHGRGYPVVLQRAPGLAPERKFVDFIWQPIRGADGTINAIFVQGSEVTDRVHATERQRALLDEINHRVKNMLTTVQAMVSQTLKSSTSPQHFSQSLQARLSALSSTHNLLTARNWSGAWLRELIEQELTPYGSERAEIVGEDLLLTPRRATNMGLVFHELATNAAKYGALSSPSGRVTVSWHHEDPDGFLVIDWVERGGPTTSPPARQGFGSRLIERTIRAKPGATYSSTYGPEGLHWQARLPPEPGGTT